MPDVRLALVELDSPTVVDDVRRACEDIGFLVLTRHRVDPELVAEVDSLSREFFDLPTEEKLRFRDSELQPDRPIYRPLRSESLGATSGGERHADLKESLDYGPTLPGVGWPERPAGLQQALRSYLAAMNDVGAGLRHVFARALDRDADFFEPLFDDRASSLRVINYPEVESRPEEGELRAGAHRDYGFLTILRSENVAGGLEVQLRGGEWIPVDTPPDSFVVNLGDMLGRPLGLHLPPRRNSASEHGRYEAAVARLLPQPARRRIRRRARHHRGRLHPCEGRAGVCMRALVHRRVRSSAAVGRDRVFVPHENALAAGDTSPATILRKDWDGLVGAQWRAASTRGERSSGRSTR
jgi:isopenicillin N synthase-like dioxygenase